MLQLFLVFHLSCASGYLPLLSCLWSYISTYSKSKWSLEVFFSIFIRALVDDNMFGFFYFLVCSAMFIALCWNMSVMFLFRLSMSSRYSSAVNLFFSSSWNVFFIPVVWVSTLVCVFLFRSFLLSALVFRATEPITILWSLPMLMRFLTVTSVTMLGLSSWCSLFHFSVSIRASPCPSAFLQSVFFLPLTFLGPPEFGQSCPYICPWLSFVQPWLEGVWVGLVLDLPRSSKPRLVVAVWIVVF